MTGEGTSRRRNLPNTGGGERVLQIVGHHVSCKLASGWFYTLRVLLCLSCLLPAIEQQKGQHLEEFKSLLLIHESLADCWSSRELQACQCSVGGFKPSVYIFAYLTCCKKEEQMGHLLLPSFSLLFLLSFSF